MFRFWWGGAVINVEYDGEAMLWLGLMLFLFSII
jgi:hypothetical protein